jgi:hypothetical protein
MLGHASAAMTRDVHSGAFDEHLTALAEQMDAAARAAAEARVGAVWAQPPTEQAHESNRARQPGGPRGDRTHNPRIKSSWGQRSGPTARVQIPSSAASVDLGGRHRTTMDAPFWHTGWHTGSPASAGGGRRAGDTTEGRTSAGPALLLRRQTVAVIPRRYRSTKPGLSAAWSRMTRMPASRLSTPRPPR